MPSRDFATALCARIGRDFQMTPEERRSIEALPVRLVQVAADHAIVREGDRTSHSAMVLAGVACTSRNLSNGKRQIMAFHIREDMPDLLSLHLETMDSDVSAVSDCTIAFVEHSALRQLWHSQPRIGDALCRMMLVDAAIFREWVVNVGLRTAEQRLAHLFMEFLTRMENVGLGGAEECAFPMTQADLAEATGMSAVHVNRSIQSLRAAGLIKLANKVLRVPDRRSLAEIADFTATYLHLRRPALAPH